MYKECSKCSFTKSTMHFHKCKASKDGFHNQCKECRKKSRHSNRYSKGEALIALREEISLLREDINKLGEKV